MVKSSGNSICTQNYSNFVSQNNRYIYAYVQRVIKADFLLSFVTRCCSALGRGKIKPQKSTGKVLVRVQYKVMQSLVYIKRLGEYGTPVCTLGIHSITQLEGKIRTALPELNRSLTGFCVSISHETGRVRPIFGRSEGVSLSDFFSDSIVRCLESCLTD